MTTGQFIPEAAAAPSHAAFCANCNYALTGLPSSGVCPECGSPYRDDIVVLYGDVPPGRGAIHNGSRGAAILAVTCLFLQLPVLAVQFRSGDRVFPVALGLLFLSIIGISLGQRLTASGPGRSMVRMNRYGCLQCDVHDDSLFATASRVLIYPAVIVLISLTFFGMQGERVSGTIVGILIAMAIAARIIIQRRRLWRQVNADAGAQQLLEGTPEISPRPLPIAWTDLPVVQLDAVDRERFRLTCRGKRRWAATPSIDLISSCPPDQAAELASRLSLWSGTLVEAPPVGGK